MAAMKMEMCRAIVWRTTTRMDAPMNKTTAMDLHLAIIDALNSRQAVQKTVP